MMTRASAGDLMLWHHAHGDSVRAAYYDQLQRQSFWRRLRPETFDAWKARYYGPRMARLDAIQRDFQEQARLLRHQLEQPS
jgi:hypothetical protein